MNNDRGIVYMLVRDKHGLQLALSLYFLRLTGAWAGPVAIAVGDTAAANVADRLRQLGLMENVTVHPFPHEAKRNGSYARKTHVNELSPFYQSIFLDADTAATGASIDELWPRGNEMVFTTFAKWVCSGRLMAGRCRKWSKFKPENVERAIAESHPAINTGVFGLCRDSDMLPEWQRLCDTNPIFISDETSCQVLWFDYNTRLVDDRYNCCPRIGVNKDRAVFWHFHGRTNLRKIEGRRIWLPLLRQCVDTTPGLLEFGEEVDHRAISWLRAFEQNPEAKSYD